MNPTIRDTMTGMPIPAEEIKRYNDFCGQIPRELGSTVIPPNTILWHYTTGPALIGIVDSGSIFATQLSCLNDTTELRYASTLFQEALSVLNSTSSLDATEREFIDRAVSYFKEDPENPAQAVAHQFVTCFSDERDDLSQWRAYGGGENGYAIGFKAGDLWGCPLSMLARMNYNSILHRELAQRVAIMMVQFLLEGIKKYVPIDIAKWSSEFFDAWERAITMIAPLVKDPAFAKECEFRIIKSFQLEDLAQLKFIQKGSLMSRHLPLQPPMRIPSDPYRLPIAEVMVGPCRHPQISRTSVDTLLRQKGYPTGMVTISQIPFQMT
jgi:hypothetical protein